MKDIKVNLRVDVTDKTVILKEDVVVSAAVKSAGFTLAGKYAAYANGTPLQDTQFSTVTVGQYAADDEVDLVFVQKSESAM